MLERLPYFRLHPADYLLDTQGLSLEGHGIYCLLMFTYYWNGSLPQDRASLETICGVKSNDHRAELENVLARFFKLEGHLLVHRRIDRELEKMKAFFNKQHNAAAASVAARALKAAPVTVPPVNSTFVSFWELYPKKVARAAAEKAWASISPDDSLLDIILAAVATQRNSPDWLKDGGRFIPKPANWLEHRRWEDEELSPAKVVNARCYYCPEAATSITNDIPHCSKGQHMDWAEAGSR